MHLSTALLGATPVVDVDGTLFVQGAIFLALYFVLKPLLFKPWLEVLDRRAERIEGAVATAEKLQADAKAMGADYDQQLSQAREKAVALRSESRSSTESQREQQLAAARTAAGDKLDREKARIDADVEAARSELDGRVSDLAKDITAKVLGRPA